MAEVQVPLDSAPIDRARELLLSKELDPIVDMVVECLGPDLYRVSSSSGRVDFKRITVCHRWEFEVVETVGENPIADQSVERFVPLAQEMANRYPTRSENSYPFAYESIAQLFDSPDAPDLCVIHTSAHNWEDHGGERGEHGSLGVVQARAPFVLAGKGVKRLGIVDRACQLVDVAPTIAALLGCEVDGDCVGLSGQPRPSGYLRRQDGDEMLDILDGETPELLVGLLFDGCNPNVLFDMAALGDLPNVARLIELGLAYRYGAMSSLPTVTLANHTSILTGAHPGHHGILHNAWWERATARQIITNSPATWANAMESLNEGVETVFQAIKRSFPSVSVYSVNEPCDVGADYSTFDIIRSGSLPPIPPAEGLAFSTERFVRPHKDYALASRIDSSCLDQALALLDGEFMGQTYELPKFLWLNFSLPDAAFHNGGPHSEIARASLIDTDARLGAVIEKLENLGIFDSCAFVLVADHGMEDSNPEVTGDWGSALTNAGLDFRDEAYGFLYFGVSAPDSQADEQSLLQSAFENL